MAAISIAKLMDVDENMKDDRTLYSRMRSSFGQSKLSQRANEQAKISALSDKVVDKSTKKTGKSSRAYNDSACSLDK